MGAAYVLTGSVNQACVESGSSDTVRQMLAEAEQADVIMAPAADMFEMGVKVQVLKRGTHVRRCARRSSTSFTGPQPSLEAIPAAEREPLEKNLFRACSTMIWQQTRVFPEARSGAGRARRARCRSISMALVFRWYLGQSSRWANAGEPTRQDRLPGLVRPGDGRVQRVDQRLVPGAARRIAKWPTSP